MGSGRDDRNQIRATLTISAKVPTLQWGPVVMTGIRIRSLPGKILGALGLQWGPVVMTGISS